MQTSVILTQHLDRLLGGSTPHVGWDGRSRVSRGPKDFCVDRHGRTFILGTDGDAVYCFNAKGNFKGRLPVGSDGRGRREFSSLDVDCYGRVYCYDTRSQQVVVYGVNGDLVPTIRVQHTDPVFVDLVVSPEGRVFGLEAEAYYELQDGALTRVSFQWPSQAEQAWLCPWTLADDGCLYLHETPGQDRF
jgi:hypothetical protein